MYGYHNVGPPHCDGISVEPPHCDGSTCRYYCFTTRFVTTPLSVVTRTK